MTESAIRWPPVFPDEIVRFAIKRRTQRVRRILKSKIGARRILQPADGMRKRAAPRNMATAAGKGGSDDDQI